MHFQISPDRLNRKKSQYPLILDEKDCLQRARELVYKSLDAADQADVKRQALIILDKKKVY